MPDAPRPHPAATVIENLVPLAGVLFFGWSVAPVMVVYWIENGLRGLEAAARLVLAGGEAADGQGGTAAEAEATSWFPVIGAGPGPSGSNRVGPLGRLAMSAFFLVHYGIFWAVHGVFVFLFFAGGFNLGPFGPGAAGPAPAGLPRGEIDLAAGLIGATLAGSLARDLARSGVGTLASALAGIGRAYGRMVVLHLSILLGGFAVMLLGSPTPALVLLIALKTAAELGAFRLALRPGAA